MKHRINVVTGICSACGLSNAQKLTTDCIQRQLDVQEIKAIVTNKLDFKRGSWLILKPKPTYQIVSSDELPPEVHEMITQLMYDLGFTEAKPTTEELAAGIAEVFSEAFKVREVSIKTESPDFSDDELELLQQIKDNPIPVSYVLSFGLSKPNMDRLRTLIKYDAVRLWETCYQVTAYGDGFLTKPEVFITDTELAFMLTCQRDEYLLTEINESEEAWNAYQSLYSKRLVTPVIKCVELTQAGHDHIAKLCSIPL